MADLVRMPMDSTNEIPSSLRRGMNSVDSVTTLNTYRLGEGKDVLEGALNVDAQYDKQSAQFVSRLENVELRFIIEDYKTLHRGDGFWDNFHPDTCTWYHVHDEITKVEDEYRKKGVGNLLRRTFREDGLTRNLTPLLEGIPDSDGLGFLKGGLIILFNAVKRRAQACAKIFACFRQVPDILRGAHEALKRFPDSRELYVCSCQLHEDLFGCLPRLIAVLLRNSDQNRIKTYAKSVFGDEEADVDRILQTLTAAQTALNLQTTRLENWRADQAARRVEQIHVEAGMIRKNQHDHQYQILSNINQLNETNKTYASSIEAQNARIESLHAENVALRLKANNLDVLNMVHQICEEMLRNRDFNAQVLHHQQEQEYIAFQLPKTPPHNKPATPVLYDLNELNMILCTDSESTCHADDLYASLRKYNTFSDKALAQAAYLAETGPFRQWLQGLRSDHLLVDGHCGHHTSGRTSPMSVFCASLIQSILSLDDGAVIAQQQQQQQQQQSSRRRRGPAASSGRLVLYFFCGQHMYDDGPLAGPQGLMRSLTSQLIRAWPQQLRPPDLQFLSSLLPETVSSAQEDIDVETVCHIFEALLMQLPASSTVHCIIDGLSYFETSIGNWAEEMCDVVQVLWRCSSSGINNTNNGSRATVKVLLASADKSTVVSDLELFSRSRIVELRAGSSYSSLISPTAFMSDLQSQASFSDLGADDDESNGEYATAYRGQMG